MIDNRTIYILLPAFNEELSLPPLLKKIEEAMVSQLYKVIICDDGSTDNTDSMLKDYQKKMPIEVITHKINRGLGETSRDLFEYAAGISTPEDVLVRLDCDDTHEPMFIKTMINKIDEGFDVVIASRFQPGGGQEGVSGYRATISRLANLFMKLLFPIPGVREYSCGFRAYRASTVKIAIGYYGNSFIHLKGLGFTGTLEKLVKLRQIGARFSEVPFVLRYDQKQSESKMVSSITTLGYIVMAISHYWPWGGWKSQHRAKVRNGQAPDPLH